MARSPPPCSRVGGRHTPQPTCRWVVGLQADLPTQSTHSQTSAMMGASPHVFKGGRVAPRVLHLNALSEALNRICIYILIDKE